MTSRPEPAATDGRRQSRQRQRELLRALRRERPRDPQHPARQRHGQGAGQRHTGGARGLGGRPAGAGRRAGQLRRGGDPAVGRAHGRSRGARRGAATARSILRDLEFKRNDWFYVGLADLTLSENRTNGPAELLQGANAPQDLDSSAGRPAGVLRERQVQRALAADRERRHARGAGRGPVQQLPRQVARLAVPAHRSGLSLPDVRRRRRRRGDGADDGQVLRQAEPGRELRAVGQLQGRLHAATSWPRSTAACTAPTRTTSPTTPRASASSVMASTDSPPSPARWRATRSSAAPAARSTSCGTRTSCRAPSACASSCATRTRASSRAS